MSPTATGPLVLADLLYVTDGAVIHRELLRMSSMVAVRLRKHGVRGICNGITTCKGNELM